MNISKTGIFDKNFWLSLILGLSLVGSASVCAQPVPGDGSAQGVRKAGVTCTGRNDPGERRRIAVLMQDLEKVRGLKFNKDVQCNFCTLRQAGDYIKDVNKKYGNPAAEQRRDDFFHHLLLLNKEQIFAKCSELLYSDQVRGLYDTVGKVLLVVTDILEEPSLNKTVVKLLDHFNINLGDIFLVHELCHALQDQNFNLGDSIMKADGNLDRELAAMAAAEGDATAAMFDYVGSAMGINSSMVTDYIFSSSNLIQNAINQYPQLKNSPFIVRALALMPYLQGLEFRKTVADQQGQAGINRIFRQIPASTEYILHPLKYVKNVDAPKVVDMSRLPEAFGEYVSLGDDSAGEYVIRAWAEKFLPENNAISAGRGWGGDTWRVYRRNVGEAAAPSSEKDAEAEAQSEPAEGESFVIWSSVWDSDFDAQEFSKAAADILKDKAQIKTFDRLVTVLIDVPDSVGDEVEKAVSEPNIEIRSSDW
ncbi:hypothetical protein IJT93_11540 [bacterium]|nr:hypothetical protein [bacterium]